MRKAENTTHCENKNIQSFLEKYISPIAVPVKLRNGNAIHEYKSNPQALHDKREALYQYMTQSTTMER